VDGTRFDTLAKALFRAVSRRHVLVSSLAGAVSVWASEGDGFAKGEPHEGSNRHAVRAEKKHKKKKGNKKKHNGDACPADGPCLQPCDDGVDCPVDTTCRNGVCVLGCDGHLDCALGKLCQAGQCVPGCQYDADCPWGAICGSSNQCEPGCNAASDCPVERPHCDGHQCYAWP
jgi:hypothetical protein